MGEKIKPLGTQEATLDRFEGNKAIFRLDSGQELAWEKSSLPRKFSIGSKVNLKLVSGEMEEKEREEVARKLLSEILQGAK